MTVLQKLTRRLGSDSVDSSPADVYAGDKWFARQQPEAVIFPRTTDEVCYVLREASRADVPVTPRGAGYGYVGGCTPVRGGWVISLERMTKIREINGRDFVAVVEPGVITGDLQKTAKAKNLFYPPDPASLKDCSIGGNIATNAGGPRCLKYGVTRNYVLGLEVVLPDGAIVRCGGRTHKNKTGFDLVGLFTGSEGVLGIVTEATLRLLPLPPAHAVLSAGFPTMKSAAAAIQAVFARGFLPAAVEVADAFTLQAARAYRPDAQLPPGNAQVIIEVDGQPDSVRGEAADLARLLESCGASGIQAATEPAECDKIWGLRRLYSGSLRATGLKKLNEDIVVPRGRLVDLVRFAERLQKKTGFPIACFGHAGDGNIHVNIMLADPENTKVQKASRAALDELFAQVLAWNGAITGEHGVGLAKMRWWPDAVDRNTRALHKALKEAIDPRGLLNPGKFV
ncbi:MAG: FAD-linked oxidase C-terminal domain-containing protein [Terrimicrobiaceae bacterium]|nr:FAD-linked oxidase C-terminal domain-containing protein [Terrimicrobiaceae bacterium]